jgi:hypothetical protein
VCSLPILSPMFILLRVGMLCRSSFLVMSGYTGFSFAMLLRILPFVRMSYKKMPQQWIYIQSLTCSHSVRPLVESGYVNPHSSLQTENLIYIGTSMSRYSRYMGAKQGHQMSLWKIRQNVAQNICCQTEPITFTVEKVARQFWLLF